MRVDGEGRNGDVLHQEAPTAPITLGTHPDRPVSFALSRFDELDRHGRQIVHPSEIVMFLGAEPTYYSLQEAEVFGAQWTEMLHRLRATEAATALARRAG